MSWTQQEIKDAAIQLTASQWRQLLAEFNVLKKALQKIADDPCMTGDECSDIASSALLEFENVPIRSAR